MPYKPKLPENDKLRAEIGLILAEFAIDLQTNSELWKAGAGAVNLAYDRATDRLLEVLLTPKGGGD